RARRQFQSQVFRAPRLFQPRALADRDASRQHPAPEGEDLRRDIEFRPGETIHTESSYKYTIKSFAALARGAGWTVQASWTDPDKYFAVYALRRQDEAGTARR